MCDCIARTNARLKEKGINSKVVSPFILKKDLSAFESVKKCLVVTEKADDLKREKPINLLATHCPFCGEKYPE